VTNLSTVVPTNYAPSCDGKALISADVTAELARTRAGFVDLAVDRRCLTRGQGREASEAESGGSPLLARPDTAGLAVDVLDDRLTELFLERRSWRIVKA
jgi:hypothetical protein